MSTSIKTAQVLGITTALLASGGLLNVSLVDIPLLQSQPGSRSLPMLRWFFSRGSHWYPAAAAMSSTSFIFLAYRTLSPAARAQGLFSALVRLLSVGTNSTQTNLYLAATALAFGIYPATQMMIPVNFRLIEMNELKGGKRSEEAAAAAASGQGGTGSHGQSAEESANSVGQPSQWTDLSGPQGKTKKDTSEAEDDEVRELLQRFAYLNGVRAGTMLAGGILGILAVLV